MRLLVTGGAGFIGSNFVRYWVEQHPEDHVVVYDVLTYAGNRPNLSDVEDRIVFVQGDICDGPQAEKTLRDEDIDTIVHFAAESHNSLAVLDPGLFFRTNVVGTQTLLEAARQVGVDRFHHISTCEVYGDLALDTDEVFTESSPYRPRTPYNASKAGADHAVRAYGETYELPVTITNCSNNYGPFQFPEKLIPLTLINILKGKPLPVYGDGLQVRDWLHVTDHCEAISLALTTGKPGEVYNIGGNSETTNIEIVRTLCALVDETLAAREDLRKAFPSSPAANGKQATDLIVHVRDRPGHDRRYAINYTKAQRELGYAPARDLAGGLRATLDWYLDNTPWWKALLGRDYAAWVEKNYSR